MNYLDIVQSAPPALPWDDQVAWLAHKIAGVEGALVEADDFEVKHMFKGMWYVREMELPADYFFIGRVHLLGHIVKLLEGSVHLIGPDGWSITYTAPAMIHTKPGFQTVCYTLDAIRAQSWHFNPDGCRDIDDLEAEYFGTPQSVLERGAQLAQEIP